MSAQSPAVILYSSDGYELSVIQNTSIPSNTRALLNAGTDGTNAKFFTTDASGNQVFVGIGTAGTPLGGVVSIQGVSGGQVVPVSGTITANAGAGNFTVVQSTASNFNATVIGTTAAGSSVSTGLITVQGNASGTPIPVTGTFSSNMDGYATSSAPTYVNNTFNPVSLTLAGAIRVDGSAITQPVSGTITVQQSTAANLNATVIGTVTSNQGTANTLSNAWPVEITDGANILGTSSHPVRTDPTGTTTQPVSGTVTANAGSGSFAVIQATASNLNAAVTGTGSVGTPASGIITVQGISGATAISVITNKSSTSTVSSVNASATNTVLLASNSSRVGATIYNNSKNRLYVKYGTTASFSSFSALLMPSSYFEVQSDYVGEIDGIWDGNNGNALVSELTP